MAVALARSLFRKGADFAAAMAFEIASTNLVVELGIIMVIVLGWQFTVGEFVGGPLMIVIVALLFRRLLTPKLVDQAREQADRGLLGPMEGHAEMDVSVQTQGTILTRLVSRDGFIFSFVCSVGNVPLAAILGNGGISFGGVLAFIFADLIILPILDINRRYYGRRMMLFILGTVYLAMAAAGLIVDLLFKPLRLERTVTQRQGRPGQRPARLHHGAERRLPLAGGGARLSVHPHRRAADAPRDEQADGKPRRSGARAGGRALTR